MRSPIETAMAGTASRSAAGNAWRGSRTAARPRRAPAQGSGAHAPRRPASAPRRLPTSTRRSAGAGLLGATSGARGSLWRAARTAGECTPRPASCRASSLRSSGARGTAMPRGWPNSPWGSAVVPLCVPLPAAGAIDTAVLVRALYPRRIPVHAGALKRSSQWLGHSPRRAATLRLPGAARMASTARVACAGSPATARAAAIARPARTAEHPAAGPARLWPSARPARRRAGSSLPWEAPSFAASLPRNCLNNHGCGHSRQDDDGNDAGHPEPEKAGDEDENAHAAGRDEDAGDRRVSFADVLRLLVVRPCLRLAFNLCGSGRNVVVAHAASLSPFRRGRVITCGLRSRPSHRWSRRDQNVFSS